MAISEAEKRKALRERRAAKMANATARLDKITGDTPSVTSSTTTTAPSPSPSPETSRPVTPPVPRPLAQHSQRTSVANKRISQSFNIAPQQAYRANEELDDADDPPEESLDEFQKSLDQLLASQKHQHEEQPQELKEMDMFAKMLGIDPSMLKGPNGEAPPGLDGSDPLLSLLQQAAGNNGGGFPPQSSGSEEGQYELKSEMIAIERQKNDKFKAQFMLLKLVFISAMSLYFFFFYGHHSTSYYTTRSYGISTFTRLLTAFEVVTVSYYASVLHRLPITHYNYNSKILDYMGLVPEAFLPSVWKNRIKLGMKYWELIELVLFDISSMVVIFGILSFLH